LGWFLNESNTDEYSPLSAGKHSSTEGIIPPWTVTDFERDLIQERTHAGLAAARARGRTGGRPKKLADPKQLALARRLYADGQTDVATICRTLGISRATLYHALKVDSTQHADG
jgi:DNA invertase Pin-like site-specific DNA recombinase